MLDLYARIEASREIESLLSGFAGQYIPAEEVADWGARMQEIKARLGN